MTLPTPKQKAARTRNWRIFQLRSLYYLARRLSKHRARTIQQIIDAELLELGAETETSREQARREAFLAGVKDAEASSL